MTEPAQLFIALGGLFLIGLLTDFIGKTTPLPRVSLLLLFGFLVGPAGLDLLPDISQQWFPIVADMALMMIGFLLGGTLTKPLLHESGRCVLWISITAVLGTALVVFLGLMVVGVSLPVAILLAAIAPATAPAATFDVVHEVGGKGPFSNILLAIVALDDAWGLMLFTILLSLSMAVGGETNMSAIMMHGAWDIGGSILLGIALGVPMAYLTGRVKPGDPTLAEALGMVFICGGLAHWLEVSFLLASMVMGAIVTNLANHHSRPFHAIEGIEWPFLVLFFTLAGASLHVDELINSGSILILYIGLRIVGRFVGATSGAVISKADEHVRKKMWLALMPQAGVAVGMALVASQRFPELADVVMPVILGGTVFFEFVGPIMTKYVLKTVGEANGSV